IVEEFLDDLTRAQATLASIEAPDVKLPLHFGMIRLDFNGDGTAAEDETLWKIYARIMGTSPQVHDAKTFSITFDRADGHWLRGYCHLLMSMCEVVLAHDTKELFDCAAHLFFPKTESPHDFLVNGKRIFEMGGMDIADVIAFIHLMRLPVKEP